jgi:hypothetical protein
MCARLTTRKLLIGLICVGLSSATKVARAIDAGVARKCESATYDALPPPVPGNPAVSSSERLAPGPCAHGTRLVDSYPVVGCHGDEAPARNEASRSGSKVPIASSMNCRPAASASR